MQVKYRPLAAKVVTAFTALLLSFQVAEVRAQELPGNEPKYVSAPGQSADPWSAIYRKLDEQLQLGFGRIDARPRPEPSPSTSPPSDGLLRRSGDVHAFRRQVQEAINQSAETLREKEEKRNEAFFAEVSKRCGPKGLVSAYLGMSQQAFESCGQEVNFGGELTHFISAQEGGVDARLYVFALGAVHKVYAVNQQITRIEKHSPRQEKNELVQVGAYPELIRQPQMVALSGGNLFGYGQTYAEDWNSPAWANLQEWATQRKRISTSYGGPPFMWDNSRQGWIQLPNPPACGGRWHRHTLSVLANDRVLIAGGMCDISRAFNDPGRFEAQTGTALWDARQQTWLAVPRLNQARLYHTASVLDGSSVLLVGGFDDPLTPGGSIVDGPPTREDNGNAGNPLVILDSVEKLSGDRWQNLPSLHTARAAHTATVLGDGRVLVAGGVGQKLQAIASVELWDPAAQSWLPGAPMPSPRYGHTANLLSDGRVLVSGGIDEQERLLNSTALYDPVSDTWRAGAPMPERLQGHSALALPDGRVLVAGGLAAAAANAPDLISWHPSEAVWRHEARHSIAVDEGRYGPGLVQVAPGKVLLFGNLGIYLYQMSEQTKDGGDGGESGQVALGGAGSDLPTFPADWWKAPAVVKPPPAAAPLPPPGQPGRLSRLAQDLWAVRNFLGGLFAILLAIGVLAYWRRKRDQEALADKRSDEAVASSSRGKGRLLRVLIYSVFLLIAVPKAITYWRLQSGSMDDECRLHASACLDAETGLLAGQVSTLERSALARPRIPCAFVGSWVSRRESSEYHIDLTADGRYRMPPSDRASRGDEGYWAVQGKYMLWRSITHQVAEMDINRIVSNDGRHFELIEMTGLHSHFDRQADLPAGNCEP